MLQKNMKDRTGKDLTSQEIVVKAFNRLQNILLECEIMVLHWVGYVPIHHIRRFFYRLSGIKIGKGSTLHMGTRFYDPRNISIGKDTVIGEFAVLDGRASLQIGDHVDIASEVMIYNAEHNIHSADFESKEAPVVIDDYVFIGPRAIILPGVHLKKGVVVAAGAVVTKNVDEFVVVGGIPAVKIAERKVKNLSYKLGRARWFR
jgi:acetyltransferase-like isoleucine patch superfamily enzyme